MCAVAPVEMNNLYMGFDTYIDLVKPSVRTKFHSTTKSPENPIGEGVESIVRPCVPITNWI